MMAVQSKRLAKKHKLKIEDTQKKDKRAPKLY